MRSIEEAHERMLSLQPGGNVFEADFAFHIAVALASRNPYFTFALGTMLDQIRLTMSFTRELQERPTDQVAPRIVAEHGAVIDAIRAADSLRASAAMDIHMGQSVMRLLDVYPDRRSWVL